MLLWRLRPLGATFLLLGLTSPRRPDCRGYRNQCGGPLSSRLFTTADPSRPLSHISRFQFIRSSIGSVRVLSGMATRKSLFPILVRACPSLTGLRFLIASVHAMVLFSLADPRPDLSSHMRIFNFSVFGAAFRFSFWRRRGSVLSLSAGHRFPPIFSGIVPGLVVVIFLLILASQRPNPTAIFCHSLPLFQVHACFLALRRP